ncbi:hypothetical protein CBM2626_B140098 [Cupriavidus taiwanensis]|uniref:hypothetical protein n=1 Tax=Cupriavidus taiwanensis TaxID=164546 RepID=UPI000E11C170|nr:hypothetical protein [Cupriavidus taiwanensis]SPA02200.1 hypothetical protein CBM2626_B140098 [Cupriavidus taiwanensis]
MQHPQHRIAHRHCLVPQVDPAPPRNHARTTARTNARTAARIPARQPALPPA